ncbi:MAG: glycosyltransferase family 2 protein [Oscillospiraceae bacterium]|nr:glycosyltransferase family 2 protein [Oscillospiraceae bacterium]
MNILYFVVPCYNEQEVLSETVSRLTAKLNSLIESKKIDEQSRIVFVDDGSKDATWEMITRFCENDHHIQGIKLSRNRGHQNALLGGLMTVKEHCDFCISLDADLQDDIDAVDRFIEKYQGGCDIVYGVRSSRETDTSFKRTTALAFYKLMKGLGVDIVYNHADYRLMSKRALYSLSEFGEVNLFLRGMVPLVGYKSDIVEYKRHERFAGQSKYPLKKMLAFAFDGITSFSVRPIRMVLWLGVSIFFISLLVFAYALACFVLRITVPGWTTIVASIWALGGIQLLAFGIIGEYIGKIYKEVKKRPNYVIEQYLK